MKNNGNFTAGIILLTAGVLMLLSRMDVLDLSWLISWPVILIIVGLVILIRHRFRNGFGFFLILLGTFFFLRKDNIISPEFESYLVPIGLIILGIYFILLRGGGGFGKRDGWSQDKNKASNLQDHDDRLNV